MIYRYLLTVLVGAFLMVPGKVSAIPVNTENISNFYQLGKTRYACYYDQIQQQGVVGKINSGKMVKATRFKRVKSLKRERKKLRRKIAAQLSSQATKREKTKRKRDRFAYKSLKKKRFPKDCTAFTPGNPPSGGKVGPGKAQVCRGQTFKLPVFVKELNHYDVSGIDLLLTFDETVLEPKEVLLGSKLAAWKIVSNVLSNGEVRAVLYTTGKLKSTGEIVSVKFKVKKNARRGKSQVVLARADFNEKTDQTLQNGTVVVKSKGCSS